MRPAVLRAARAALPALLGLLAAMTAVPSWAVATEDLGIYPAPDCAVGLEFDRQDPALVSARLRPACPLSLESARMAFAELLSRVLAKSPELAELSVFLGRAVDFPWLSHAIAQNASASVAWDAAHGAPRTGRPEDFVRGQLAQIAEIATLFAGWRILSFGVEKALVTEAAKLGLARRDVRGDARLPFDGMIWIRLRRVR